MCAGEKEKEVTNDGREGFYSLYLFIYLFFFVAVVLLELLLAGGCDIERSADPSVSGSFGWNQSRFKGPSSSSSWVLRVLCVCGSYNESGGTFHLDGWQRNLVCLVFSSRHFNM
jgi:hypothetical protein